MGYVVADSSVAAHGAADQQTVFVRHAHCHAVDLQFDDPLDRLARQEFGHPRAELAQLVGVVRVFDRQHRHPMLDLGQFADRLIADPLRGAVGRDVVGMLLFQALELGHQAIVVEIADLGRGEHVVLAVVKTDLLAQFLDALLCAVAHASPSPGRRSLLLVWKSGQQGERRGVCVARL